MQLVTLWNGDTPEARVDRIKSQLEEATADLGRATIRLRLEEGTQPIVDAYKRVQVLWYEYQYKAPEADLRHDHAEVAQTLREMEAEVEDIITMAKSDLDRLETPI
jgi:hypothetical protein